MIRRIFGRDERDLVRLSEAAPREKVRLRTQTPAQAPEWEAQPKPRRPASRAGATGTARPARSLIRELSTRDGLRRAFLLTEILGPPVSLRGPRDGPWNA